MKIHQEITSIRRNTYTKYAECKYLVGNINDYKMVSNLKKTTFFTGENYEGCHLVDPSAIASAARTRCNVLLQFTVCLPSTNSFKEGIISYQRNAMALFLKITTKWGQQTVKCSIS